MNYLKLWKREKNCIQYVQPSYELHVMAWCFVITDRKENTDLPGQETFQKSKTLVLPLSDYCMPN